MKKLLVAVVVIAVVAVVVWQNQKKGDSAAPSSTHASSSASSTDASSQPNAALSAEAEARTRADAAPNVVQPKAPAPAAPAAEPATNTTRAAMPTEVSEMFVENAMKGSREMLLADRDKLRTNINERFDALRAERNPRPREQFRAEGLDEWSATLRHVPAGSAGKAVSGGYDKEQGGTQYDVYVFDDVEDVDWVNALLELKWLEDRLREQ